MIMVPYQGSDLVGKGIKGIYKFYAFQLVILRAIHLNTSLTYTYVQCPPVEFKC